MFVRTKTHQTLKQEHQDLLAACTQQLHLLREAKQIFAAIPASRLSQTVKEQIEQWREDVAALADEAQAERQA